MLATTLLLYDSSRHTDDVCGGDWRAQRTFWRFSTAEVYWLSIRPLEGGQLGSTLGGVVMWHGASAYLLFALVVPTVLHAISRRYAACTLASAALCSMLNLVHEAWVANWQVNFGWAPPIFVVGSILALPISALAGIPWLALRRWRARTT